MIICYYSEINKVWDDAELEQKLALFPLSLKKQILQKKRRQDIQLSVAGKLLLLKLLAHYKLDSLSLSNLNYSNYLRPYFDAKFDFSIAHSGNLVICCGTVNNKIGADIEKVQPIDFSDYKDHFTANEWKNIYNNKNSIDVFFDYWTKKEAILKAEGSGLHTSLLDIDVTKNDIAHNNRHYHFHLLKIKEGYKCNVCSTNNDEIQLLKSDI